MIDPDQASKSGFNTLPGFLDHDSEGIWGAKQNREDHIHSCFLCLDDPPYHLLQGQGGSNLLTIRDPSPEYMARHVSWILENYSYNGMEICREINGYEAFDHSRCHFKQNEKGWGQAKGGCKYKENGCKICQRTVLSRLDKLEKKGLINSLKMRFFDNRNPGCFDGAATMDLFRFFYTKKSCLATRLIHDIETRLGSPEYL